VAGRIRLGKSVFTAAIERIRALYARGDSVVVSFSAGKDSGVLLEMTILAATVENKLPVQVVMRDEEIMFPGTYEYAERVANRPEVDFHWVYACQPIINIYNRKNPYFWVFDPELPPEKWMRQPPPYAYQIPQLDIQGMSTNERFPPGPSGRTMNLLGLRAGESARRAMGLHSSRGYIAGTTKWGVTVARPIYDWTDGDIFLAINKFGWDYNRAYDVMHKLGMSRHSLRIAPPTMVGAGLKSLQLASKAWPEWFDALCERCPGVEQGVAFGRRWIEPFRKAGETWEQTFWRECVDEAPPWIANRARTVANNFLRRHKNHTNKPFPEIEQCHDCAGGNASWELIAKRTFHGDPFSSTFAFLPYIEPYEFRPHLQGTPLGSWQGGKPNWG
jgi:predicted phosphoadenosine phosphosulfate sulfurtransferase